MQATPLESAFAHLIVSVGLSSDRGGGIVWEQLSGTHPICSVTFLIL